MFRAVRFYSVNNEPLFRKHIFIYNETEKHFDNKMENKSMYPPVLNSQPLPNTEYPQPPHSGYPPPGVGIPATYSDTAQGPQVGFQAPPPNYNQSIGATTIVVTQGTSPLGPQPSQVICPSCHATVLTHLRYEPSTKTHLIAVILCCFICWPCAWVPYCMDSCQSANHYCPNCNSYLGSYDTNSC